MSLRLQQRTACVMRYAVQNGIIDHNPASDLTGAVSTPKVRHHPALDLNLIPDFLERIDDFKGRQLTQLAVKLALLLFIRSSELRFARWDEIDLRNAMWTIPAEREPIPGVKYSARGAKMRSPHLVPCHVRPSNCCTRCGSIADREQNWCSPAIIIPQTDE
jgi:integrase